MISTREKQLKVFEALTMFEQRIVCHKLPKSFNEVKVNVDEKQSVNKQNKMIQETKRQMLNDKLAGYEIKIQQFEQTYQQKLKAFESDISKTHNSYQQDQTDAIMNFVKTYLDHQTKTILHNIRYKESCRRAKLLRHRHSNITSTKKIIDVYPQIIVDVPKVSLNSAQLNYLSRNGKYNHSLTTL